MDSPIFSLLCAPLFAALYLGLSLWLGERFPFSRYSMYSSIADRSHGAVPVVFADGQEVEIDAYQGFSGIETREIYPQGIACSLEWRVREMERWIDSHQAAPSQAQGPVQLQVGFRILEVDGEGRIEQRLRITAEGAAHRR